MRYFFLAVGSLGLLAQVPNIVNPVEPGPYTLVFEEDLRFGGGDGGDEFLWLDGTFSANFDVDAQGHFFVADAKNSRLLEFDEQGAFVALKGGRGQGPGEYQNLVDFFVLQDGTAIGYEALGAVANFSYYDADKNFVDRKSQGNLNKIIAYAQFAPNGDWFFAWYLKFDPETSKLVFFTGILDAEFEIKKVLSEGPWPSPPDPSRVGDPDYWVDNLAQQFKGLVERGTVFAQFLSDGSVLIADKKKYAVEKWSPDLSKKVAVIEKKHEPIPFTAQDKEALIEEISETVFEQGGQQAANLITDNVIQRAIEKADLPPFQNPIAAILPMENAQFAVVRQTNLSQGTFSADMFDPNGSCIGRFSFPGRGLVDLIRVRVMFKNGFAYAMERNEDGDNQLVRYSYKMVQR